MKIVTIEDDPQIRTLIETMLSTAGYTVVGTGDPTEAVELIKREQPDLVLCGHIHEARGTDTVGSSRIVNPGPVRAGHYAFVEIDGELNLRLDA